MRAPVTVRLAKELLDKGAGEYINRFLPCNVSECDLDMSFFSPCIDSLIIDIGIRR